MKLIKEQIKETRDVNFYHWQNKVILSLINNIEDSVQEMFHVSFPKLHDQFCLVTAEQGEYKKRSKLITLLEDKLQNLLNGVK